MKKSTFFYILCASLFLNLLLFAGVVYYFNQFQKTLENNQRQVTMIGEMSKSYDNLYSNYETLRVNAQGLANEVSRLINQPTRIIMPPPIQMPQWHSVNCNTIGSTVNCSGF